MTAITWLGHSTCLLEVGDARLLTDPLLRGRVAHLRRHGPRVTAPDRLDGVLLSHLHADHLDVPSLRAVDPRVPVVVARGAEPTLRRSPGLRTRDVLELEVGEHVALAGARVEAVRADHDGRRIPFGAPVPAVGFSVTPAQRERPRVHVCGDTDLFDAMADHAGADVALVPIWGWGPSAGAGHLDPRSAAAALALLRPRVCVPVHFGTYLPYGSARRLRHVLDAPLRAFERHAASLAPDVEVRPLAIGERLAVAA